eukprot:TRINITY_DN755_c1_g1_i1.p1 TRINITY_DN755_c1_g1~~TRINITY_DN755_c1_g1_i1.p1  ORF type:complete len:456 (+),score=136.66 TRINITY_DN755_c1_g1_i1:184-1551(+)
MEVTAPISHSLVFSGKAEFPSLVFSKSATLTTMFSIVGRQLTSGEIDSRLPIHLVCVVDRSGSMMGEKMEMVKSSLEYVLEQLLPKDKLTLVTFSNDVTIDFSGKMTPKEVSVAQNQVSKILASGGTHLSGGLLKGLEILRAEEEDVIQSLILFTDGMANSGIRSPKELKSAVLSVIEMASSKPTLHTFGFGRGYSKEMLNAVTESTEGGTFNHIQSAEDIAEAFGGCLGSLLSVVAQNISITINPGLNCKIKAFHGRLRVTECGSDGKEIEIGDFYAEGRKDILLEMELPELSAPIEEFVVCRAKLSFMDTLSARMVDVPLDIMISRGADDMEVEADLDIKANMFRVRFAKRVGEVKSLVEKSDVTHASEELEKLKLSVHEEAPAAMERAYLDEIEGLKEALLEHESRTSSSIFHTVMMSHSSQRRALGSRFEEYQSPMSMMHAKESRKRAIHR